MTWRPISMHSSTPPSSYKALSTSSEKSCSSADAYSLPNGIKRRSVVASLEDVDNNDPHINHKYSSHKRQKNATTHSIRTLSETLLPPNGKAKVFPSLREQREQLPIAQGATCSFTWPTPLLPLFAQVGSRSCVTLRLTT